MSKQVREIDIRVRTNAESGLKQISKGFAKVNRSIRETTSVLTTFRNVFFALQGFTFAGLGIREIVGAADAMQKLQDRLKLSEGSTQAAQRALGNLTIVANTTKSSIEDIAVIYNRLNLSLRQTGISSEALMGFTAALQNTFRLSGATASEAAAATIQLSQGLASGQLRGQELRSVLEQNALAGDILAKQFGTTRGELLKFSEANGGLDAAGVLAAFANESRRINDEAAKLQPTIGEGLTTAFNKLKVRLGEVNQELGITQKAVKLIDFTFENMGGILTAAAALTLWVKRAAILGGVATAAAKGLAILKSVLIGVAIAISPLYLPVTAAAGAIALLGVSVLGLSNNWGGVTDKIKDFLKHVGLIAKKSEVEKMRDGWFAATSAQNNYVTSAKEGGKIIDESLNPKMGEFAKILIKTSANLQAMPGPMERFSMSLEEFAAWQKKNAKLAFNFEYEMKRLNEQFLQDGNVSKYNAQLKKIQIQKLDLDFKKGSVTLEEYNKRLQEIKFGKSKKSLDEMRIEITKLNKAYQDGNITMGQYSDALEQAKINRIAQDLKTGKTTVIDFQASMNIERVRQYRRAYADGFITMSQFNAGVQQSELDKLNQEFQTGRIGVHEYNKALVETSEKFRPGSALQVGLQDYIKSAGTLSQNVASAVTQTFGNLENYMVEFTKNGKFKFREFAEGVLEDLNRVIMRALILRPLADGIVGAITAPGAPQGTHAVNYSGGGTEAYAARGAAFDGGRANFFAAGGVVSGRTSFNYGSGKRGVMGEAGPEAILPLKRDGSGNLGVRASTAPVIVNIHNETGGEVEQKESTGPKGEKILDIIITQKVKETFASGAMDKQMSQQYGLKRRGM